MSGRKPVPSAPQAPAAHSENMSAAQTADTAAGSAETAAQTAETAAGRAETARQIAASATSEATAADSAVTAFTGASSAVPQASEEAEALIEVRVLMAFDGHLPNDVITVPEVFARGHRDAVDANSAAVRYAKGLEA